MLRKVRHVSGLIQKVNAGVLVRDEAAMVTTGDVWRLLLVAVGRLMECIHVLGIHRILSKIFFEEDIILPIVRVRDTVLLLVAIVLQQVWISVWG